MDEIVIPPRKNLEFTLVIVMLGVLTALVAGILFAPVYGGIDNGAQVINSDSTAVMLEQAMEYREQALSYRQDLLAIVLTAFGAWVGAGAAYFFGRENLRVASESMLAMRGKSSREQLREIPVRSIPPRAITWTVAETTLMDKVGEKVQSDTTIWFVPVVDQNGVLQTVIHEEMVWRHLAPSGNPPVPSQNLPIKQVIDNIKQNPKLAHLIGIYAEISLDTTLAEAEELMRLKNVYLAVVVDDKRKPTHFITTGDLRSVLMQDRGMPRLPGR